MITIKEFDDVEMCIGTVIRAEEFPAARKPAIKLWIDFGGRGILKSSAQVTALYTPEKLTGTQVIAVLNLQPRQIADFISECLVLGAMNEKKEVVLIRPDREVENGTRIS